jgi:hypothetical protein
LKKCWAIKKHFKMQKWYCRIILITINSNLEWISQISKRMWSQDWTFKISRLISTKSSLALSKFNLKISLRPITISTLATHSIVNLQAVISILDQMTQVGKDSTLVSSSRSHISRIHTTMKAMATKRCSLLK